MKFKAQLNSKNYIAFLKTLGNDLLPKTIAKTLNSAAAATTKQFKKNVKKNFTIRSNFTLNSIRNDRIAKGNNIDAMQSRVVSVSPYLDKQEFGSTEERVNIPTLATRSGNFANTVKNILRMNRIGKFVSTGNSSRSFFLGTPKGENRSFGIWMRSNKNKKLTKIRNIAQGKIRIKKKPSLQPAIDKYGTPQYIESVFNREASKYLN